MTMPAEPWTLPLWAGDLSEIIAATLTLLRLGPADVDAERMDAIAGAAVRTLDRYLDSAVGTEQPYPPPPELFDAAVLVTVRMYRAKDAPTGVVGGWSDFDTGPAFIPNDVLTGVYSQVRHLKSRWGVG